MMPPDTKLEGSEGTTWHRDDYDGYEVWDAFAEDPFSASEYSDDEGSVADPFFALSSSAPPAMTWTPRLRPKHHGGDDGKDGDADKENKAPRVSPDSVADLDRLLGALCAPALTFDDATAEQGHDDPSARGRRAAAARDHEAATTTTTTTTDLIAFANPLQSPRRSVAPAASPVLATPWARVKSEDYLFPLDFEQCADLDPNEVRGSCARCGDPVLRSQPRTRCGRVYTHLSCPYLAATPSPGREGPPGGVARQALAARFARYTDDRPGHFQTADDWDLPASGPISI